MVDPEAEIELRGDAVDLDRFQDARLDHGAFDRLIRIVDDRGSPVRGDGDLRRGAVGADRGSRPEGEVVDEQLVTGAVARTVKQIATLEERQGALQAQVVTILIEPLAHSWPLA